MAELFTAGLFRRTDIQDGVRQFADAWAFNRAAAVAVLLNADARGNALLKALRMCDDADQLAVAAKL